MKTNKKKVFVTALAVSLIAILSLGTLAWFNAEDEITNTFKVADSDGDGKPDFSIDVTEDGDAEDDGLEYKDILPGDELDKEPVVTNTGDYDQYVRVNIIIDKDFADEVASEQGVVPRYLHLEELFGDLDKTMWLGANGNAYTGYINNIFTEDAANEAYIYTLYYNKALAKDASITVFEKVLIPSKFVQSDMEYGTDGFEITVKAEAVQVKNLNATNAYKAFAEVNWAEGTEYTK